MEFKITDELQHRLARDIKDRAEAAERERKANLRHARETRQARMLAKAELGYGSW
jgi:hypothetical protein